MNRYFVLILSFVLISTTAFSADWDDFDNVDRMWDGQKTITDKEFEEVMDALQENQVKKEEKIQKKKAKKISGGGQSLHKELDYNGEVPTLNSLKKIDDGVLFNTSVNLLINNVVLEKGYYKVLPERDKENNRTYINFYQSQFFKARLEVKETDDDFGKDVLDFVEIIPYDENFVKLIFGSLDFNAYTYVEFL